jgi:hypothetical protein
MKIEIETTKGGTCIWSGEGADRRWILDASTIRTGGCVSVCLDSFNIDYNTRLGRLDLYPKELNQ